MRNLDAIRCAALAALLLAGVAARAAEESFDACDIFTQQDAEQALGTTAAPEPVNPKVRRPKVITECTYTGFKDSKPVAASVQFRFGRTDAEAQQAFEDARLQFQTKPLLIAGLPAFWSAKTGQMNLLKGRTWIAVTVGAPKADLRFVDDARKLTEILIPKI
ncbi:MAG TPA: hypothetical protein VEG27_02815 [Usitatibacter sp.]|nr:hypothetical protein [Usitatibacter sp.]